MVLVNFSLMQLLSVFLLLSSTTDSFSTLSEKDCIRRAATRAQQWKLTLLSSTASHETVSNRRDALNSMMGLGFGITIGLGNSNIAAALDMDAFMNSQVSSIVYHFNFTCVE
jgi:hypothetical protein